MLRWFETRIDPFAREAVAMPPSALLSFYWYFARPIWPVFALILFLDLLAALSEVLLATFLAQLIDLMKGAAVAANLFRRSCRTAAVDGFRGSRSAPPHHPWLRASQKLGAFASIPDPGALADTPLHSSAKPRLFPE
jgi:hypothetical protein